MGKRVEKMGERMVGRGEPGPQVELVYRDFEAGPSQLQFPPPPQVPFLQQKEVLDKILSNEEPFRLKALGNYNVEILELRLEECRA